ncbi:hypothetical protein DK45_4381 [Bordetella bronchiseptica]|nr:hypothetical protein DK45_4381 [Bordetella bronchiseptica]
MRPRPGCAKIRTGRRRTQTDGPGARLVHIDLFPPDLHVTKNSCIISFLRQRH